MEDFYNDEFFIDNLFPTFNFENLIYNYTNLNNISDDNFYGGEINDFDTIQKRSRDNDSDDDEDQSTKKKKEEKMFKIIKTYRNEPKNKKNQSLGIKNNIHHIELNQKVNKSFKDAIESYKKLFEQLHDEFIKTINPLDKVRIVFQHDLFNTPISFPFMKPSELTPDIMLAKFSSVVQSFKHSNDKLQYKYKFIANITIADLSKGGYDINQIVDLSEAKKRQIKNGTIVNGVKIQFQNYYDQLNNSTSVLVIKNNNDNLCFLRAVLIAKLFDESRKNQKERQKILYNLNNILSSKKFYYMLEDLKSKSQIFQGPCGYEQFKIIEDILKDYQIMVIDENFKSTKEPVYLDKTKNHLNKWIYLALHNNHFYVNSSMRVHLKVKYFCDHCKSWWNARGQHKCGYTCEKCYRLDCFKEKKEYKCDKCKIDCFNESCLAMHQTYYCKKFTICTKCNHKILNKHVCGDNQKWCPNCCQSVELEHRCHILTEKQKNNLKKNKNKKQQVEKFNGYIFFDYEAYEDERGIHVPNLIVAQVVCKHCMDLSERCNRCNRFYKFYNNDEFCKWLLQHENYIALAHNLQGYDGVFIANYFLKTKTAFDQIPNMIATPTKLLCITFRKLKIIDSYSFLQMPLDKISKTYDLKELKKGFFPHKFNKPENMNYIGPYPDKKYYNSEYFSIDKKNEFDTFYEQNCNKEFNFKKEFEEYCTSDVKLLAEGCLQFRKIIMEQTKIEGLGGVDPFRTSITIASLCNHIYRRNFMKEDSIGLIPENGYNPKQKYSMKSLFWLKYQSYIDKVEIRHARSIEKEKQIGLYTLDGYCEENKTIYEFNGCFWHGCPKCYTQNTWNPVKNSTMGYINYISNKRIEKIQSYLPDHTIKVIWECEFDKKLKEDESLKKFLVDNPIVESLNPRDALYGGRTNAFVLYKKCDENQRIDYDDATSLYPTVQKQELYPISHPIIITENFGDYSTKNYFGLIKCKMLPPFKLYAPVLPVRVNNKLLFSLCLTCACTKQQSRCFHGPKERAITGTWTTKEVDYALKKGYTIVETYEIWHWEKKDALFKEYVDSCIKEKQEASGFPKGCITEEQKLKYISDYELHEGIKLDYDKIKKNPGARHVAKLKANSQWGFLAMLTNRSKHKFVTSKAQLFDLLNNDRYIVHEVIPCDDNERMQVYYSDDSESHFGALTTNVAVAAFVTSYARLRLYQEIEKLDDRVLYFDTDSIIYISNKNDPNQYKPKIGDYLGEFKSEIDPDEGDYITEFVSAGPKNYAYKLNTGITHCTVKGFTLSHIGSLVINYDNIKHIVCEDHSKKLEVNQQKFVRDNKKWEIHVEELEKCYGFVYDKRILKSDLTTLPYGY